MQKIEDIREEHLKLADPSLSGDLNIEEMPSVVWLAHSIHGDEASGFNAVPLVAYYLAAAQGDKIEKLLEETVIHIDPCMNPDGLNRFTTWVNTYGGKQAISDSNHVEHLENWPRGRTNHYWFDLNRDWLLAQQPESKARLVKYHQWLPNILNDHHEMQTDRTFFFQPGVQSRINPHIPENTNVLNKKIGRYHAKALDKPGVLYFTEEAYDDFYAGKSSTYPDLNGGVGILFEQASSRGLVQDNRFGKLELAFGIRNQLLTSLSSLEAASDLRIDLLEHQRNFYKSAMEQAGKDDVKEYVFGEKRDRSRLNHFLELLAAHHIQVNKLASTVDISGTSYQTENSFVVKLDQPQNRLIKSIFEKQTTFEDSIFYDVSTCTIPLAFNLEYAPLGTEIRKLTGEKLTSPLTSEDQKFPSEIPYAYAMRWDDYYAPRALYQVLSAGCYANVASRSFSSDGNELPEFKQGTIVIPTAGQKKSKEGLRALLQEISIKNAVTFYPLASGLTETGIDLGSSDMLTLKKPEAAIVVGSGISSLEAGEIWHLLDQRYEMTTSLITKDRFKRMNLEPYTVLIMPGGSYGELDSVTVSNLNSWLSQGGTLIAFGKAANWLSDKKLASIEWANHKPYLLKKR